MTEILMIGVALLLFFGPYKLPEFGKSQGKGIQECKKASKAIAEKLPCHSIEEEVAPGDYPEGARQ